MIALITYSELTPFDWVQSADQITMKLTRIDWLPLRAYYGADSQSAIFDLGKKFMLLAPLGFLLAMRQFRRSGTINSWIATLAGLILGVLLEGSQLFQLSHITSVTDVLTFAMAAYCGSLLFLRYEKILELKEG